LPQANAANALRIITYVILILTGIVSIAGEVDNMETKYSISIERLFILLEYAIGKKETEVLRRHHVKYGNINRTFDLAIKSVIIKNYEFCKHRDTAIALRKRLEEGSQTDMFLGR
jgi:hypothetical protein